MNQTRSQALWLVFAIVGAMAVGVVIRWQWISVAYATSGMQLAGYPQPTTPDALWHAASIRHHGVESMPHIAWLPNLPDIDGLIHVIGVAAVRLLHVPLEVLILWGPVWLSSLLAIPLVFIGREIGSTAIGFAAAALSLCAPAFFERTMAGAWDHDMLAIAAAATIILSGMVASRQRSALSFVALAVCIFMFPFIYARGLTILAALVATMGVAELICRRGSGDAWRLAAILALAAALSPLSMGHWMGAHLLLWCVVLCGLVLAAVLIVHPRTPLVLVLTCMVFALFIGILVLPWNIVAAQLELYMGIGQPAEIPTAVASLNHDLVHGHSIQEMRRPSMQQLGQQVAGWWPIAVLGVLGWAAACRRDYRCWFFLPLVLFGVFSLLAGVRFAVWAVVPISIGIAWAIWRLCQSHRLPTAQQFSFYKVILAVVLFMTAILPSVVSDVTYPGRTVLLQSEVEVLQRIGEGSNPEDIVVTWWDWGTAVALYAGRRSLIHPGRMTDDVFVISRMITSERPLEASTFGKALGNAIGDGRRPAVHRILADVRGDGTTADVQGMVDAARDGSLSVDEESQRSTWIYWPIETVAYLDQIAEYATASPSLGVMRTILAEGLVMEADGRWRIPELNLLVDAHGGHVSIRLANGTEQPIRPVSISVVTVDEHGHTRAPTRPGSDGLHLQLNELGSLTTSSGSSDEWSLHLILLPQARTMLLLNDAAMKTNAVQMGVLGRYDQALFEEVVVAPRARAYRVK